MTDTACRAARLRTRLSLVLMAGAALATGCASLTEPAPSARKETVVAITERAEVVRFNAGQPGRILERRPLVGLPAGDRVVGIDFRVARGTLYVLTAAGRLFTLDVASGRLGPVGPGATLNLTGTRFGVDFNPVADRIRVVSDTGLNLRLHPDTGAVAAADPPLQYDAGDARRGRPAQITAAGYTYNKTNDRLTTNYAIDTAAGLLVTQGSEETVQPAVSPNTGRLFTVGELGTGPVQDAAFDIADVNNAALAAIRADGRTRLHLIDLRSGRATLLGTVGDGAPLWGMAIEP